MRDPDILFGKLALGRGLLAREDALSIARELTQASLAGRAESFAATAVRLGYLDPTQVRRLGEDMARGELVCRGGCGRRRPCAGASPRDAGPCPECGGAIYLARRATAGLPGVEEPLPPGRTGLTVMELDVPVIASPAPPGRQPSRTPVLPAQRIAVVQEETGQRSGTEPLLDAMPIPIPDPRPGESAERTQLMEGDDQVLPLPGFEPFTLSPGLRVVAPIGKGGTGSVYRGIDATGRVVAVKVLRVTADQEALKRFDREVRISTLLDHPQIVKVLETGTVPPPHPDAGKPWCAMEYVQGHDLNAWITERPRSPEECARLILRLCDPVEHAHGKGVVHRDIKPGNVLVRSGDGLPVLCDFGLARYRSRGVPLLTDQGDILGTPAFMSPEQARGDQAQIGPPTDVHALGAVLYRLVTGRPPFQGPTPFATIEAVVRQQPAPPRQIVPAVSAGLEAVILKALAKDPRERYHTASRMKVALGAACPPV